MGKNINNKSEKLYPEGFLELSISELNYVRGGFSEDRGSSKEKDVYDTREG
jgi:hypothetical protein